MNKERWTAADRLLDAALDRKPHERAAFLREACADDEELRRAVESLLENERDAGRFLDTPALELMAERQARRPDASMIGRDIAGYRVVDLVGAGGMGEVYRARDSRLGRDVAVKVLPRALTNDVDRFARIDREARVLAALNHPQIASIYGLEDSHSGPALILEFVEGPTLADRLTSGALPIAEALPIARQIADALDAAHEKGIIHRDLKPANIKVRPDGFVKVLDFGLAKAIVSDGLAPDLLHTPTVTAGGTKEGIILGTAAYMSPEQARGQPVDKRTDIWAFGCILFEMLAGRAVFTGATLSDTIAAVVGLEPDWSALPSTTPPPIHHLLRRCLTKDRKGRSSDASVARVEIDETLSAEGQAGSPTSVAVPSSLWGNLRFWIGIAALLLLVSIVLAVTSLAPGTSPSVATAPVHFQEPVMGRLAESGMFSISPDGRQLLYASEGADGVLRLWVRTMSTIQPGPLPGSEVFKIVPPAIWSPDSRFVAFNPPGVIKKVSLDGGAPQSVCDFPGTAVGGSWNREGEILLGNAIGGLMRCPASGGPATVVTVANQSEDERHIFPSFLSDGRHFVYLSISRTKPETSGVYAGELGPATSRVGSRLITTGFNAAFVAPVDSEPGLIVFARDGALFAHRFNEQRLEMIGDPIRLADRIGSYLDGAFFSVSSRTLVYRGPDPDFQLTWFDRQGRELGRVGTPARFSELAVSPDGNRALVARHAPQGTTDQDLWLFDLTRNVAPRRMTFEPELEHGLVWSTDDRFVFSAGGGASGVYQQTVGGPRQLLFKTSHPEFPTSVSSDGRTLLYATFGGPDTATDVWVRTGDGNSASAKPFLRGQKDQGAAQLSPDRRWVAYVSNEAGPNEIFVTEFRFDSRAGTVSAGESIRISEGGGFAPRWRQDGRELLYLTPDGSVMTIDVDIHQGFRSSAAKRLFKVPGVIPQWGVTKDGARFLFAVPVSPPPPFNVVQDWQAMLPK
jgi:serine/threonine protein kinase